MLYKHVIIQYMQFLQNVKESFSCKLCLKIFFSALGVQVHPLHPWLHLCPVRISEQLPPDISKLAMLWHHTYEVSTIR